AGNPFVYRRLATERRRTAVAETEALRVQDLRTKAERAWRNKDFRAVEEAYSQIEEALTPAEKKRLEYVRRQPRHPKPLQQQPGGIECHLGGRICASSGLSDPHRPRARRRSLRESGKETCPGAIDGLFGGGAQLSSSAAQGPRPDALPRPAPNVGAPLTRRTR